MHNEELLNRGLPKWPQMIVTGKTVPKEAALEVIRRTDDFFGYFQSGNDHDFIDKARRILGMPNVHERGLGFEESAKRFEEMGNWLKNWGVIKTEYVFNSWISCSWVGGPHGWMHPDGEIGYCNNVGKWPSCEEIYEDWKRIAEAFPLLELEITLMSGEESEADTEPVISFLVRNGNVEIVDPAKRNLHAEFWRTMPERTDFMLNLAGILNGYRKENAIPLEQIQKWADEYRESQKGGTR